MGSFKYHSYRFPKFIWLTQVCSSSKYRHFEGEQTKELESEKYEDSAEHVEIVNVLHNTPILYAKNVNILYGSA